jgi:putative ABC transport system permease protein
MNTVSILASSARRRFGDALLLVISTAISVMAIATFTAAAASPTVASATGARQSLASLFASASFVTAVFAALSGWFFAEHYLSRRKREVATWLLVGMRKRVAFGLLSAEFGAAAIVAFLAGAGSGLLLSRFFSLALTAMMKERTPIAMPFGEASFTVAGVACIFQFLLASARSAITVSRVSIADLMRSEREAERPPRARPFLAAAGVVLILASYAVAVFAEGSLAAVSILPVLVCTIAGTFLCFGALVPTLASSFRKRKAGVGAAALVAAAQISFRSRRNARLLALTAVLVAVAATACGTVIALNASDSMTTRRYCPHDIELAGPTPEAIEKVDAILADKGHRGPEPIIVEFARGELRLENGETFTASVFSRSAWAAALESLGEKAGPGIAEGRFLSSMALSGVADSRKPMGATLASAGASLALTSIPARCLPPLSFRTAINAVILSDQDYGAFKAAAGEEKIARAAIWDEVDPDVVRAAHEALSAVEPRAPMIRVDILAEHDSLNGAMLFVGIFLAAVFLLCAISLLVFRVTEDSRDDADRYRILQDLGATRSVVRKSIVLQDLFSFGLPLVFGLMHCTAALVMMRNISGYANAGPTMIVGAAAVPAFLAAMALAVDRQLDYSYDSGRSPQERN